jgi:hypothetical protein
MPIGLTYLYIALFGGFSWTVNTTNPFPTGLTYIRLQDNLGTVSVSVEQWAVINAIQTIVYMHTLSAADVDAVLQAIWTNKANYTYSGTPVLTLTGNTAPNGTYQAASPPSTGKEYSYDLHYGTYTSAGPEWTVITA